MRVRIGKKMRSQFRAIDFDSSRMGRRIASVDPASGLQAVSMPLVTTRLWRDSSVQPLGTESSHSSPRLASLAQNKWVKVTAVDSVESGIIKVEKRQQSKEQMQGKCKNSVF
jgi:hypothetical protein